MILGFMLSYRVIIFKDQKETDYGYRYLYSK